MKKKNNSKKDNRFVKIIHEILKTEFKTDAGKVNLAFGFFLIVLCGLLTAKEWILKIISMVLREMHFNENEYQPTDTTILVLITIIFFVCCISGLLYTEYKKEEINKLTIETKEDKKS